MTDMPAIVTGAGQGFGLALTEALAARGATVIACTRDGARLRAARPQAGQRALPRGGRRRRQVQESHFPVR